MKRGSSDVLLLAPVMMHVYSLRLGFVFLFGVRSAFNAFLRIKSAYECVSLAPQFIRYAVNCISRDSVSHLLTHLVVYIIARCSSLNTTTFCLFPVCPVLPHPTHSIQPVPSVPTPITQMSSILRLLNPPLSNTREVQRHTPPQSRKPQTSTPLPLFAALLSF